MRPVRGDPFDGGRAMRASCRAALALVFASAWSLGAAAAPPSASTDKNDTGDTAHSASLAGVARWADAEPADLAADATYRLPGFIDKDITLDHLRRRFGAANVKRAELAGAEGETSQGFVLFDKDPARRAELFVRDEARSRGVSAVRVTGTRSRWHFANGVTVGLRLDDLVKANGKPVSFNGLDWDYGGTVTDWHGGAFDDRKGGDVFHSVSLTHAGDAAGYPLGEGTFTSGDARYPKQGQVLYVGEIGISFADAEAD